VPTGAVRKLSAPHLLPLLGVCSQQKKEVQLPRPLLTHCQPLATLLELLEKFN